MVGRLLAELEANHQRNAAILKELRERLAPLFDGTISAPARGPRRPYTRRTPEKIRLVHSLLDAGESVRQIAPKVGLSPATVARERLRWEKKR